MDVLATLRVCVTPHTKEIVKMDSIELFNLLEQKLSVLANFMNRIELPTGCDSCGFPVNIQRGKDDDWECVECLARRVIREELKNYFEEGLTPLLREMRGKITK